MRLFILCFYLTFFCWHAGAQVLTPNMSLPQSSVGITSGLGWEQNLNAALGIVDGHNHTAGNGVPIPPAGLNINSSLPFNNQQATNLQACVFTPQTSYVTQYGLYTKGVDLYFNDGSGNVIQLTSGGDVNATSSGISSGTATASFVSSVLVVNRATNTPANIKAGSILIGQNVASSNYLTLQPPSALSSGAYSLTLPAIPSVQSIMTLDTSGNISAPYTVDNSTIAISSNVIQVPSGGITATQIASSTITGSQIASNINLAGTSVQVDSQNIVTSSTNATTGLKIIRGTIGGTGGSVTGEGFSVNHTGTGQNIVSFTSSFSDTPAVIVTPQNGGAGSSALFAYATNVSSTGFTINSFNSTTGTNVQTSFIVIGQR